MTCEHWHGAEVRYEPEALAAEAARIATLKAAIEELIRSIDVIGARRQRLTSTLH